MELITVQADFWNQKTTSWAELFQDMDALNQKNNAAAGKAFEHFAKHFFLSNSRVSGDYKHAWQGTKILWYTGTDGFCIEDSEILEKEGKLIPFSSTQRVGSSTVGIGAQVEQVDEHPTSDCAAFVFEYNCYPEAKILSKAEIKAVYKRFKSWNLVADEVGASEAFVRQNS